MLVYLLYWIQSFYLIRPILYELIYNIKMDETVKCTVFLSDMWCRKSSRSLPEPKFPLFNLLKDVSSRNNSGGTGGGTVILKLYYFP